MGLFLTPVCVTVCRPHQEKLASVPCFMVCNRAGNPYLVPLSSGFDVGVVFLDPKDAEEMMQNMVQVGG